MYLMNSTREFFHIDLEFVFNDYEKTKDKTKLNRRVNFYNELGRTVQKLNEKYLLGVEREDLDTVIIRVTCNDFLC